MIHNSYFIIILSFLIITFFANCSNVQNTAPNNTFSNDTNNVSFSSLDFINAVNFSLLKTNANEQVLAKLLQAHPTNVLIFLNADCPAAQKYTLTLNQLIAKHHKIKFYFVFIGKLSTQNKIADFKNKFNIPITSFVDPDLSIAKIFNTTTSPEVVVINNLGYKIYQGAIDNWFVKPGRTRTQPTTQYLNEVLLAIDSNKNTSYKYIKPVGCLFR